MSMEYIRKHYSVPAKRGRRVEVYYRDCDDRWRLAARGRISSASNFIHVDGTPYHPTHGVVYLDDDGGVLLDTRWHD